MKIRNLAFAALLVPHLAYAQAAITEIMYDPAGADSGHEWIEVYNSGTSSIPLTAWKMYEGGANHNIIAASGDSMLAPNAYAVIAQNAAKFKTDYPNYIGPLFHSAFTLDNGGATLAIRDASLADIDIVSYDSAWGAFGDGNSLQRAPGDTGPFVPRAPTPGAPISAAPIAPKAKTPPPAKVPKQTKTAAARTAAPSASTADVRAANDAGDTAVVAPQTAAAAASGSDPYWLFALAGVALLAIAAIAGTRHFKKTEWDIVEESPEDV